MSNLRAREAMQRARQVFQSRPGAAKRPNSAATAVWRDGLRCEVSGPDGEWIVTDMSAALGGAASGSVPGWLFRAALASCAATCIAMRAATEGIELSALDVRVDSESDPSGLVGLSGPSTAMTGLRMAIKLSALGASEAQLRELAAWGEAQSPVGCTVREAPSIAVEVIPA